MGYGWLNELKEECEQIISEIAPEAIARAQYRVQRDFHTHLIKKIAEDTGHENLAQACYFMLKPNGIDIEAESYYDASFIEGFYESSSSYHQDGGKWRSVRKNYQLSRYDFWEMHFAGETGGSYGEVEEDWIMKNFWNGIEYVTNGWPLSKSAEYLSTSKRKVVSAYDVAKKFIDDYDAKGYYKKYLQQEMNNL